MASLTQWTWIWVNSGSWWWTGRPGMLWFLGLQRVKHDWVTELNWKSIYNCYQSISQALSLYLLNIYFLDKYVTFYLKQYILSLFHAVATASTCACACVCVCVWERECERDRSRGKGTYHPSHPLPLLRFSTSGSAQSSLLLPLKVKVEVAQLCPTLCDLLDYRVHGVFQANILEWVAVPCSRVSSQPRDWTQVSHISGGFFTEWATREAQEYWSG